MNLDGTNQVNISNHDSLDMAGKFSTDGLSIAWISNRDGNNEIYFNDIYNSNSPKNLSDNLKSDEYLTFQPWNE